MDESELLLTVAEISVAFAGFMSLASAFGRRSGHDDARVDAGRLIDLLTTNLTETVCDLLRGPSRTIGCERKFFFSVIASLARSTE